MCISEEMGRGNAGNAHGRGKRRGSKRRERSVLKAEDLARLIHARRVGRRAWRGKCPVHGGNSLEIKEGKTSPLVIKCQGGCKTVDVLDALGLSWGDILGKRSNLPKEHWERLRDLRYLAKLERQHGLSIMAQAVLVDERRYWAATERNIAQRIEDLKDKLEPGRKEARAKKEKLDRFVKKYGWDRLWEEFLKSERGQQVLFEWGITKEKRGCS
jgi:hypothetical protein